MSISSAIKTGLNRAGDDTRQPLPHPGVFYGTYPCKKEQDKGKIE